MGRALSIPGALIMIGAVIVAAAVVREAGWRTESTSALVRLGAVLAMAGSLIELVGVALGDEAVDVLWGVSGIAIALRVVAAGVALSPVGADRRLETAALLAVSYAFDGHTASKGLWVLMTMVDLVHVLAASAWVCGVTVLALHRTRFGLAQRGLALGAVLHRVSRMALVAVCAASAAGIAMAVVILDSLSSLTETSFGRLLLLKVALVLGAAAMGAYQRYRVVSPEEREPTPTAHRLLVIEAVVLVGVGVVTALLVAASPVS